MGSQFFGNKHDNKTSSKNADSRITKKKTPTLKTTVQKAGRGK